MTDKNLEGQYGSYTRLFLALSSLSPALALLAVKGVSRECEWTNAMSYSIAMGSLAFIGCFVIPYVILRLSRKAYCTELTISELTENKDHTVIYAIAVILPIWDADVDSLRGALSALFAFLILWFLSATSDLHHTNLFFKLCGYRVYTATPSNDNGANPSGQEVKLLAKQHLINKNKKINSRIIDRELRIHEP